jgi:Restriction endonuclease
MPTISQQTVQTYLSSGQSAATMPAKGKALEDLICYVFGLIPGIGVARRNQKNVFATEEVDIALWNDRTPDGLFFLPHLLLIECKNWSSPVGDEHVSWFDTKLRNRGLSFGILIAISGITGDPTALTAAHSTIARALAEQRQILIFTGAELSALTTTDELVHAIKEKLCDLAVMGSLM